MSGPKRAATESTRAGSLSRLVVGLLLAIALVLAVHLLLQPVRDNDLFWHVKTGEWISAHRSLPDAYLFAAKPRNVPEEDQRFIMTAYWGAQLVLHGVHAAGGLRGLVALRFLLFALLLAPLAWRARGGSLAGAGLLVLAVVGLGQYPPERPQYFSFIFAGLLLLLLEGIRRPGRVPGLRAKAAAVPLLLVVWANCHGGYVVGVGLIGLTMLGEGLKLLHPRLGPLPAERLRLMLASCVAAILASALNPNGWRAFRLAAFPEWTGFVRELLPPVVVFGYAPEPWILVYGGLLALAAVSLALSLSRPDLTDILLTAATAYFSLKHIRHVPFFFVAALPATVRALAGQRAAAAAAARVLLAVLGLAVGGYFLRGAAPAFGSLSQAAALDDSVFPVEAAAFVERERLEGEMFNFYDWGGYLLWRLAPRKVFIDGRNLDPELRDAYLMILTGRGQTHGRPFWKASFAAHRVSYVLIPFFDPLTGGLHGLVDALVADPAWVPVFANPNAIVFVEDGEANRGAIRRNALPKEGLYGTLAVYCGEWAAASPSSVPARVALGDALARLGDRAGARRAYEEALRLTPGHRVALERARALGGP